MGFIDDLFGGGTTSGEKIGKGQWDWYQTLLAPYRDLYAAWAPEWKQMLLEGPEGYPPEWARKEREIGFEQISEYMDVLEPKMMAPYATRGVPYSSMADETRRDVAEIEATLRSGVEMKDYDRQWELWSMLLGGGPPGPALGWPGMPGGGGGGGGFAEMMMMAGLMPGAISGLGTGLAGLGSGITAGAGMGSALLAAIFSDKRAKNGNGDFQQGLAQLKTVTPRKYTYKSLTGPSPEKTGFYAQDLVEIENATIEGPDGYLYVDPMALVATLWNAVKELSAQVDSLKGDA